MPTLPGTTATPQTELLSDALNQTRARENFVAGMQVIGRVNPDQFARAKQVEKFSGIPADVLSKHNERMNELMQGNRYAQLHDQYARTAQALSDGRVAAVAQDDLDSLTRIEHAALQTRFDEQGLGEKLLGSLKQSFFGGRQATQLGYADDLQNQARQFDIIDAEIARAESAGEQPFPGGDTPEAFGREYLLATPDARAEMRADLLANQEEALQIVRGREQQLRELPAEPGALRAQELRQQGQGSFDSTLEAIAEFPGYAARASAGAVVSSAEMLAAGAVGGPLAAGVAGFETEFNFKLADVLREAKIDLSNPKAVLEFLQNDELMADANRRRALKAAGTTAVDMLGMGFAGRLLAPTAIGGRVLTGTQREAVNLAAQFPLQGLLEAAGEASGQLLADGKVDGGDVLLEGLAGAGMSVADVMVFGGNRVIDNLREGLSKARVSRQAMTSLDQMVDAATAGKLRARDAEAFRSVADRQLQNTGMESLWIPAEKLVQLNQSSQIDLPAILEQIPGLGDQFAEAVARGGSVTLKTADYLTYFADYHEQLSSAVRIQVDGMSTEDAAAWQSEQEAQITELADAMKQPADPVVEARTSMVGELIQSGVRREDAEQYASTHIAVLSTLAERMGRSLEDLQRQFPLNIRSQVPEQMQRIAVDDARLAIQRLRTGDIPRPADMFGKSLGEYLRDAGGLKDEGGELAALDADNGKAGRNKLIRQDGKSLDDMALQAWERGYFPGVAREEVSPQLIVDAMREELTGKPRYSVEQENPTLRDQAASLEQLQGYLDRLGVDLATLSDDEALAILRAPEGIEGQKLTQSDLSDADPRGFITFTPQNRAGPREFQITLTARRDLSTLLHELGHFYLEVLGDLAAGAEVQSQIKSDYSAIRAWVGAEEGKQLTTDQHEQFARGFERYLAEGKSPNPELQGAFSRFKRWLIAVYKDLRRLNVELTDDIRAVMDRLVATDEQIAAASQVVQAMPLFADAQAAGMTDTEYQAYREQLEIAHEDARTSIELQIMAEEERRRSKWWRDESARVRTEVAEEIDSLPVYQAIQALRSGITPDGREGVKLQSAEVRERYGNGVLRKLAFMHAKEGGLPMDVLANLFDFQSGDEMLKEILGAPSRGQTIESETQTRMQERHGTRGDGEAAERAMAAVHNEKRAEVLIKELNRLAQQGNRRNLTSQQVLRAAAQRIMAQRKVRDIQPYEYQRAEAKAGREAFAALANLKGPDYEAAYQAKQRQLLNFYLWKEATKARAEVEKIVDTLSGFNKQSRREKLGKAGADYLDQIDSVLEQYEFRAVSLRQVDKRTSMLQWYNDQLAAGSEPYVPEFLLQNARRTNYKELSLEQLQELHEFVGHVAHLAGLKNKLLANKRLRDFEEAKSALVAAAYANNRKKKSPPIDQNTMTMLERIGDKASHLGSSLLKMEQIIEWLDGGDIDGPWHEVFWQPFVEAQTDKDDLNRRFTSKLMGLVDAYVSRLGKKAMEAQSHIRSLGQPLTRNAIISVALNTGNAGNHAKLLKGRGWSEEQLSEILSHMSEADWHFAQSLWDLVEELWPSIETLERDLYGIQPEKVEALAVGTPFGQFRGGYWPLVYDTSAPEYAGVANNLKDSTGLFEEGYAKATTPKGHTKARVDGFAAPVMLDVSIVASHLGQVIHDLTHRRAIRDAAKLIGDPEVKQALNETLGVRVADQFNPWLQGVANDMVLDSRKGIDSWLALSAQLRANLTVAWMGFSATTGLQQILGYSQSLEYFQQKGGKRYLLRGMKEFITHPLQTAAFVRELSGEMRNREANLDQNMRETLRRISGDQGKLAMIQRLAFRHIGLIQSLVDIPTWLGGYHQAMDQGLAPDIAVQAGDRAVRLSQMAAGPKDLAAVQRKDGLMRALTIVYSYWSLLWNRQADIARSLQTANGVDDYLNAFMRSTFLIALPAVLAPLLTGDEPEDDETWAEWAALKIAVYPLMGIPLLRDFASAWESGWGYRGATPIGSLFETLNRTSGALAAREPDAERITLSLIDAVGYGFGLPAAQTKRTVRYLWDVAEGERENDDVMDFMRGVLFGPPKGE